jgi:hypothetical protein
MLFELVDTKKLNFAVVTKKYDTFDNVQEKGDQTDNHRFSKY